MTASAPDDEIWRAYARDAAEICGDTMELEIVVPGEAQAALARDVLPATAAHLRVRGAEPGEFKGLNLV
ncbi:MAG: hypothetical protein IBJ15_04735 [Alphaproteobacteria bacterium]|nr:hypothetical protein [Alphaproteobacteria bacterium]